MNYNCLIIDDETMLSENTRDYFNTLGVKTAWVADEKSCLDFFQNNTADLILLDVNLQDSSGFDLCLHLRKTISVPILFISVRRSDDDVLLAFNIGGDDYIKKPYSLAVLLAKVKAVLKRSQSAAVAKHGENEDFFTYQNLYINFREKIAMLGGKDGKRLKLKAMEYKLLAYLAKNPNRIITKSEIFENVWEDSFSMENTLNVHIRRLREKIEVNPSEPRYIITARGKGYIVEVNI